MYRKNSIPPIDNLVTKHNSIPMNHLILYCHPDGESFNHAILEQVKAWLDKHGHTYRLRDLYAEPLDPALTGKELLGETDEVVKKEQAHVHWAQTHIFIYPTLWMGMPALLKGWIDRVYSRGFAYKMETGKPEGLLMDKKVIIFNTQGLPEDYFGPGRYNEAIAVTQDEGIWAFCGLTVLAHRNFPEIGTVSSETRQAYLDQVEEVLNHTQELPAQYVKEG